MISKKYLFLILSIVYIAFETVFYFYDLSGVLGFFFKVMSKPIFLAIALLSCVYVIKAYGKKNIHGRSLIYVAIGLFFILIAETIWQLTSVFFYRGGVGIEDIFFIIAYIFIAIGVFNEITALKIEWKIRNLVAMFFPSVIAVFLFGYLVYSRTYNPDLSFLINAINIFYSIADSFLIIIIFLILLIVLEYQKGKLFLPWLTILIGMLVLLLGDIFFSLYSDQYGKIIYYQRIDLLWSAGYMLIGYGIFLIGYAINEVQVSFLKGNFIARKIPHLKKY